MNGTTDITEFVERLEAFEERMEVRIDAVYAVLDRVTYVCPTVIIRGEVHPKSGPKLKEGFSLVVDVIDKSGRLVATQHEMFLEDSFFGFKSFQIEAFLEGADFSKIRIYPRPL